MNAEERAAADAVRAVEAAYDRAWADGDLGGLLDCLADDVVLVSPRGEVVRGRDEAARLLAGFLRGPARASTHRSDIVRLEFVTRDVAVVDGRATLEGVSHEGGSVMRHRFTDVIVCRDGHWRIAHVRAYDLVSD